MSCVNWRAHRRVRLFFGTNWIQADIEATGKDLTPQDLETIKTLAEHSPLHGLLSFPNRIELTVRPG
jgi:hypothetical protein